MELFKCYLSNRKQDVVLDTIQSDSVNSVTPQESTLGPLLFTIIFFILPISLPAAMSFNLSCTPTTPVAYPELVSRGVSKSRKFKWLVKVGACKDVNPLI